MYVRANACLEAQEKVFFYELMRKKGIEPLIFEFDKDVIELLKEKQAWIDFFYWEMVETPQFFYDQDEEDQKAIKELFQNKPIPPVNPKLTASQITRMDGFLGLFWGKSLSSWEEVSVETRSAYVKRFWVFDEISEEEDALFEGIDISWLAQLSVEEIKEIDPLNLAVCHKIIKINLEIAKEKLSERQLAAFDRGFILRSLETEYMFEPSY